MQNRLSPRRQVAKKAKKISYMKKDFESLGELCGFARDRLFSLKKAVP
jgi:hypothetical protein